MASNQIIYEMSLKDNLTGQVQGANSAVNKLESSLGSVKGLLVGIGIGLAAFKLGEFVHEANEEWEKMEFSMSQVEAGLKSTGGAAGLTFEELKKGAEDTSHALKFTQSEILGMQSVLLTFPAVTKETFGQATNIIADMSTRLGQDLKSSAIQLGKALQDPEKGITALRRVGVNFNDEQTKIIKNFAETNQLAKAQSMILAELTNEFGGSAQAAADADKGFRLDKTMEENRVALGEMIDKIKEGLMPALLAVAKAIGGLIDWIKKNGQAIKQWGMAIGTAILVFKGISIIPPLLLAVENAMVAAATGAAGFGATMAAALGPITLIAVAVGGLVLGLSKLSDSLEEAKKKRIEFLGTSKEKELQYLKEVAEARGGGQKGIDSIAEQERKALATERAQLQKDMNAATGQKSIDLNNALTENLVKSNAVDAFQQGLIPKAGKKGTAGEAGTPGKTPKTQAQGAKSVTINVKIDKFGETHINTTNIKEGFGKMKDMLTAALTGAVNDFQVVAAHT